GDELDCARVAFRGIACRGYRLPTEAEWEFAARAGTQSAVYGPSIEDLAWYGGNASGETHPAKGKRVNPWGLYDVIGNVYEWTNAEPKPYREAVDRATPDPGAEPWHDPRQESVVRGCSWRSFARDCRAAYRYAYPPSYRVVSVGFRLARSSLD